MGEISWRYDAPEDIIKRQILGYYFRCVSSSQRMDKQRMRNGTYDGGEVREFAAHVTGLWRAAAVLVTGCDQEDIDQIHSLRSLSARLKFAVTKFYFITKKLKSSGILRITSHPTSRSKRYVKDLGRSSGAGVADDF